MSTIDIHHHAVPHAFIDDVRRASGRYGISIRRDGDRHEWLEGDRSQFLVRRSFYDMDLRRAGSAAAGVDIAVASLLPTILFYGLGERDARWMCASVNNGLISDAADSGGWCLPMVHVPLQFPKLAVEELTKMTEQHAIRAVQIGSNVRGRNLNDPALYPFWEAADALGVLVFVHSHNRVVDARFEPYHLRNLIGNPLEDTLAVAGVLFGGVIDRFPGLRMCFSHAGGYVPWIKGRWRHGQEVRPEARADGAMEDVDFYLSKLYFDTVIHSGTALKFLIDELGAGRVLFGTDYPADMADMDQVPLINGLPGVSAADCEKIFSGNARQLLHLTELP